MRQAEPESLAFTQRELTEAGSAAGRTYLEFLRVPAMSAGLYVLPAGGTDGQRPHTEDEVYIVMGGEARFRAGERDRAVGAGDVLYVRRGVEHRFHSITRELRVLVLFAPAEHSNAERAV